MKQYNYELTDVSDVRDALDSIYKEIGDSSYKSLLFHLYTIRFTTEEIKIVQKQILDTFSDACIGGTSTNGDICDGHLAEYGMVMAVSVFEESDAKVRLFDCSPGQESDIGAAIADYIENTDRIVAAELLITLKSINSHDVLSAVEACRKDIILFGGGSANEDISATDTKVFNEDCVTTTGVLVVTYSGTNLHVDVHHAIGWKPLGKELTVTKITGKRLYEIDNVPAGKVYSKYLDIHADEDFFSNILEFPIMSHQHGYEVLRLPFACYEEDNSILLAADIDLGTPINLSYGDPDVIRSDVKELSNKVKVFAPQAIFLYSCGVRRLYWKYLINKETVPFSMIAPVAGFYSSGEIMRMGKNIIEHHVTLIAIGMREGGEAKAQPTGEGEMILPMTEEQKMHSQISMVRRLANFINVTSAELQQANDKLKEMAATDELTGLYNRRMLDKIAYDTLERVEKCNLDMVLGIVDIDNFKQINDTYGHAAGDRVLKEISSAMCSEVEKLPGGIFGRWGGEEFLFIAPSIKLDSVVSKIEEARKRVSSTAIEGIGNRTVSVGVTAYVKGDTIESIFARADAALYEAKETGRNKLCVKK